MLKRRIIACLDVRDGRVVKGVRFRDHVDAGDVVALARRYRDEGADELVFYDIAASAAGRVVGREWVARVAGELDIPFCVAGGIRSVADARAVLAAGADKVSINSPALERPALIDELAAELGSQSVVVGIDSSAGVGGWCVNQYTGDAARSRTLARDMLDWLEEAQARGAGEIVLNCMGRDGTRAGFDLAQLAAARARCTVPLVASGGAGTGAHFRDAFAQADVDAALAAGAFHDGTLEIPALKRWLAAEGVAVRP